MNELSTSDRRIVEGTLRDVKLEDVPRLRQIHEDALRELRPQYEAIGRAIAMREAALERLDRAA